MNSVQISDFLNSNNIKTPHNKTYNYKIVWSSIKKYRARLKGLYEELGIKVKGKKFAIKSLPSKKNKFSDSSGASEEEE